MELPTLQVGNCIQKSIFAIIYLANLQFFLQKIKLFTNKLK